MCVGFAKSMECSEDSGSFETLVLVAFGLGLSDHVGDWRGHAWIGGKSVVTSVIDHSDSPERPVYLPSTLPY